MRTALVVSLLVHGAAAAALALFGTARDAPEPLRWLTVSMRADDAPGPELTPAEEPELRGPPAPAESWPIPDEAPALPEIEAPEAPGRIEGVRIPPVVRLPKPLRRPAPRNPSPALVAPAAAGASPARTVVVREPRLLPDSPRARYPARARRLGLEGTVVLLLHVAADGTVARVEVATSSGHGILDRAAADAARSWRFEPACRDDAPVARDVRVPVEFRLTDA